VVEYLQLLDGVTRWDVGVERQVEITGPDAFAFANVLVARDLAKLRWSAPASRRRRRSASRCRQADEHELRHPTAASPSQKRSS
jgi:hypothetical protein